MSRWIWTGLWGAAGKRSGKANFRLRWVCVSVSFYPLPTTVFLLLSELPTIFDAVVVVWARFAVERCVALRKLILPAISSCLHWFGLYEDPEERFLSQSFTSAIRKLIPFAPIVLSPLSSSCSANHPLPIARVHRLLKRHPLEIHMIPYVSSFRIFTSDLLPYDSSFVILATILQT